MASNAARDRARRSRARSGGLALVLLLGRSLTSSDDDLSRSRLDDLTAQAREGRMPRVLPAIGDDSVAQVVGADSSVLASSSNIVGASRFAFFGARRGCAVRTVHGPDDAEQETYRLWANARVHTGGHCDDLRGDDPRVGHEVTSRLNSAAAVGSSAWSWSARRGHVDGRRPGAATRRPHACPGR